MRVTKYRGAKLHLLLFKPLEGPSPGPHGICAFCVFLRVSARFYAFRATCAARSARRAARGARRDLRVLFCAFCACGARRVRRISSLVTRCSRLRGGVRGGGRARAKNENSQFVHQESEFGAGNLTSYVRSPTDIPGIPNLAERAVFAKVESDP